MAITAGRVGSFASAVALTAFLALPRPAAAAQIVFMNFNSFPFYPGITTDHFSDGLDGFTASAFTLTGGADLGMAADIRNRILAFVREDFADFDIEFRTSRPPPPTPFVQWGMDDRAYTFKNDPVTDANDNRRLHGKADSDLRIARTFAGSFSLTSGNQPYGGVGPDVISNPRLQSLGAGDIGDNTLIARALANNASHEIAHLFGATHTQLASSIMTASNEQVMATLDKIFLNDTKAILFEKLGAADGNAVEMNSGSPVSIVQTISIPDSIFQFTERQDEILSFDYLFKSPDGKLTVSLGGAELFTLLAPATPTNAFTTFTHTVPYVDLLALNAMGPVDLVFTVDQGRSGGQTTVLLDNILFAGLTGGTFRSGSLGNWAPILDPQNRGSVAVVRKAPEPGMLALFGLGLAGLGFATRRRAGKAPSA